MDNNLEKLINEQITKEYYSSYFYLAMVVYFEAKNLPGFSHWMKVQVQEEMVHGTKFFNYLNDRGGKVILEAIDKSKTDFKSPLEVFTLVLAHEKFVTDSINNLYAAAQAANDNATAMFLQWFITEQVEEEKNASDILARLTFVKEDPMGLLMLDKELSLRPPPVIDIAV